MDFSPPTLTDDSLLRHAGLWASRQPLPAGSVGQRQKKGDLRISLAITHPDESHVQVKDHHTGISYTGQTREEALVGFWVAFYAEGEVLDTVAYMRDLTPAEQAQLDYILAVKDWEYRLQLAKGQRELDRKRRDGIDIPLEMLS